MIELKVLDKIVQFESSEQGAEAIIKSISDVTMQSGLIIDCLDIDGIKIYTDFEEYIKENTDVIKHVSVNLVSQDKFITDIIRTAYSYVQGALPKLQPIIDNFYTGEADAVVIDDLKNLMEGIIWIISVSREIIDKHQDNVYLDSMLEEHYDEYIRRLEEAFNELKNAVMNMDFILIADIINYEVIEIFSGMSEVIQNSELIKKDSVSM